MRIPPDYEEMIKQIAQVAGKHGFYFCRDALTDTPPELPDTGHSFEACIYLKRHGDFKEDAPILISHPITSDHTGR